ncbi:MAG: biotin/lipoyl-containing protein, partial [Pseudomonadota bacterium]
MSAYSFKLPDLGEGIVESEISAWHVSVGDSVEEDDLLADVQTDKAIVEVTSPVSGTIAALGCDAGEVLAVGAELVSIATEDAVTENIAQASTSQLEQPAQAPADQAVPKTATPTPTPSSDAAFRQVLASPSLRKRAREEGINLADVPGSGPKGRISHQDFDAFLATGLTTSSTTGLATAGDLAVQAPHPQITTREIKL